jgi:regulator of sigma E protease
MIRPADENREESHYDVTVPADAVNNISGQVLITIVMGDSPAEEAGIQAGDLVTTVNGDTLSSTMPSIDLIERTQSSANQEMVWTILRDGEIRQITVTPRDESGQGQVGASIQSAFRTSDGVQIYEANPQQELTPKPLGEAVVFGFTRTYEIFELIVTLPAQIINGAVSAEEARPVSIVGISQIGGSIVQQSVQERNPSIALNFMALISIFLGITNLLPIPALDGGRIVFVLIEMVRGKPVPPHIEAQIHYIGMALLLLLGVIVIIYDIVNPLDLLVQ